MLYTASPPFVSGKRGINRRPFDPSKTMQYRMMR